MASNTNTLGMQLTFIIIIDKSFGPSYFTKMTITISQRLSWHSFACFVRRTTQESKLQMSFNINDEKKASKYCLK